MSKYMLGTEVYDYNNKLIADLLINDVFKKDYTIVLAVKPWTVIPFNPLSYDVIDIKEHPEMKQHLIMANINGNIYAPQRVKDVIEYLSKPNFYSRFCKYYPERFQTFKTTPNGEKMLAHIDCRAGANFIAHLFINTPDKYDKISPDTGGGIDTRLFLMQHIVLQQVKKLSGVYLFLLENSEEEHAFVAYFKDNKVTIFNSYGDAFFVNEYNREAWLDIFINFYSYDLEKQKSLYHTMFGFREDLVRIFEGRKNPITFDSLMYTRLC